MDNYRLTLAVGTRWIASIDGRVVDQHLKDRAAAFPPICTLLVNAGWIATKRPPAR
jgi:hypothetical protein